MKHKNDDLRKAAYKAGYVDEDGDVDVEEFVYQEARAIAADAAKAFDTLSPSDLFDDAKQLLRENPLLSRSKHVSFLVSDTHLALLEGDAQRKDINSEWYRSR